MQIESKSSKKSILNKILGFIFLEECVGCGESGENICSKCRQNIKNEKNKNPDMNGSGWINYSLSYKNEVLRKALFALKYYHNRRVAKYIADIAYQDFLNLIKLINRTEGFNNILILPIPISHKRLVERDYNQSEVLISGIIRKITEKEHMDLESNLYIDLLLKQKHTIKFAHTHSHSDRENLIKDAFKIHEKYTKDFLENKKIVLVDDITTTGATFYEARKTLINAGATKENIFGYAIAH